MTSSALWTLGVSTLAFVEPLTLLGGIPMCLCFHAGMFHRRQCMDMTRNCKRIDCAFRMTKNALALRVGPDVMAQLERRMDWTVGDIDAFLTPRVLRQPTLAIDPFSLARVTDPEAQCDICGNSLWHDGRPVNDDLSDPLPGASNDGDTDACANAFRTSSDGITSAECDAVMDLDAYGDGRTSESGDRIQNYDDVAQEEAVCDGAISIDGGSASIGNDGDGETVCSQSIETSAVEAEPLEPLKLLHQDAECIQGVLALSSEI